MKKREKPTLAFQTLQKLLEAAFTVCAMHPSLSATKLDQLIADARLRAHVRVARRWKSSGKGLDYNTLGYVIHRWRRSPRYLTDEGEPAPIRAQGRAPSIEALFREATRPSYFKLGLKHLIRLGQIKRTSAGRYLPCEVTMIMPTLTPEFFDAVAQTIQRLIATVLGNTSPSSSKSSRLVERMTFVPDLPRHEIPEFRRFALDQAATLVNTMDDWLESRRSPRKLRSRNKSRGVSAGLHVFAFIDDT
jgi:hypothetical protein